MQAQIDFSEEFSVVIKLLTEIRDSLKASNLPQDNDEWLNGATFCKKYNISRPTLYRNVKAGDIETQDFGNFKRYRWTKERK